MANRVALTGRQRGHQPDPRSQGTSTSGRDPTGDGLETHHPQVSPSPFLPWKLIFNSERQRRTRYFEEQGHESRTIQNEVLQNPDKVNWRLFRAKCWWR